MKTEHWALIVSISQTLVALLAFLGLAWQLKQIAHNIKQDAYSRAIDDYSQMMRYLLENPKLNRFFYEGIKDFESLSEDQKDFYNYIALSMSLFERIYFLAKKGVVEPEVWTSWERWLFDSWFRTKLFETFWSRERTFFTTEFCKFVDVKFEEYKKKEQIPQNDNQSLKPISEKVALPVLKRQQRKKQR